MSENQEKSVSIGQLAKLDGQQGSQAGAPPGTLRPMAIQQQKPPTFPEDINYADEYDAALHNVPKKNARLLSFTAAALLFSVIVWAWFAELDEVVHADGQVVGSQRTQVIQNLEGGILSSLNVREGQIVQKDQVLATLENDEAEGVFRDNLNKYAENALALLRLEAEAEGTEPIWPDDVQGYLERRLHYGIDDKVVKRAQKVMEDQKGVFDSRRRALNEDIDILQSQNEQRRFDLQEQKARLNQLQNSYHFIAQQRDTARKLYERRNFSKIEYLDLEQKTVDLAGQIDVLKASIPKAEAAIDEAARRINSRLAEHQKSISEEIGKRRIDLESYYEMIRTGKGRVLRTEIKSPVYGSVRQIYSHTTGGVIRPGESIMDIVPLDNTLLVEAKVLPKDVAFIRPDQKTTIKVTAYDYSKYGGLDGHIENISADTIDDPRGERFFLVRIRTDTNHLLHNGEKLQIIPGMTVMADIMTGKKTVMDYIMKPVLKVRQNALRES